MLDKALLNDPPVSTREGGMIKEGYNESWMNSKNVTSRKDWIAQMQQKEVTRTGIKSLKIGYNSVFDITLEVTKQTSASSSRLYKKADPR